MIMTCSSKKLFSICFFLFAVCSPALAQSLQVPYLAGRVNDTAGLLSQATIEELEAALKAHEDSTSNQVVVLTLPGLQGEALEDYSMRVVETWKIGQANSDNGVLLLIVRDERKMRIEVGSGLEGDLPDITCGRIIRHEITPRFRDGDYDGGVRAGVRGILAAIAGAYTAGGTEESSEFNWAGRRLARLEQWRVLAWQLLGKQFLGRWGKLLRRRRLGKLVRQKTKKSKLKFQKSDPSLMAAS